MAAMKSGESLGSVGSCLAACSVFLECVEEWTPHYASVLSVLRRLQIFKTCGEFYWPVSLLMTEDETLRSCWSFAIMWANIVTERSRDAASERWR
jgi:hypothetical protein